MIQYYFPMAGTATCSLRTATRPIVQRFQTLKNQISIQSTTLAFPVASIRTVAKLLTDVLITNEMHNFSNQYLFHDFLSALHVSNESSRSSSEARHNILYYIVWYNRYNRAGESSCFEVVGNSWGPLSL